MSNHSENEKKKEESKHRNNIRKEKLGVYFLNMSQVTFVAWFLGSFTPLMDYETKELNWLILIGGVMLTIIFGRIGNTILK